MTGRSTTLQLLHVLDKWATVLDREGELDVIYFDFMKVLDTVRLLGKIKSYGIDDQTVSWMSDFLTGREWRVSISATVSECP